MKIAGENPLNGGARVQAGGKTGPLRTVKEGEELREAISEGRQGQVIRRRQTDEIKVMARKNRTTTIRGGQAEALNTLGRKVMIFSPKSWD